MTSLRVGVIGLGVGEKHLEAFAGHPDCGVRIICDLDPGVLERVASAHPGVLTTTDAGDVLGDPEVDAVSIASYDSHHFDQVIAAIEAGKHVFVEKPMCQFEQQARDIRAALERRPEVRLSSNLPLRCSPRFLRVRELVSQGAFGRLFYAEADYRYGRLWKLTEGWRGREEHYSVVLGGAVHMIDLLLWWTGENVVSVSARGNQIATAGTQFRFDDLVVALLEFESGLIAKVSANFGAVHPHFHATQLFGAEATFINGVENGHLYRAAGREAIEETIDDASGGAKGELIHSFVESILGRGDALVSVDDVFRTLEVCFAIQRAVSEERAVPVQRL